MMYVEWYGVCNFVVFSVVEICIDYGGVYVFHVCFDLICALFMVLGFVLMSVVCICFMFVFICALGLVLMSVV